MDKQRHRRGGAVTGPPRRWWLVDRCGNSATIAALVDSVPLTWKQFPNNCGIAVGLGIIAATQANSAGQFLQDVGEHEVRPPLAGEPEVELTEGTPERLQ